MLIPLPWPCCRSSSQCNSSSTSCQSGPKLILDDHAKAATHDQRGTAQAVIPITARRQEPSIAVMQALAAPVQKWKLSGHVVWDVHNCDTFYTHSWLGMGHEACTSPWEELAEQCMYILRNLYNLFICRREAVATSNLPVSAGVIRLGINSLLFSED